MPRRQLLPHGQRAPRALPARQLQQRHGSLRRRALLALPAGALLRRHRRAAPAPAPAHRHQHRHTGTGTGPGTGTGTGTSAHLRVLAELLEWGARVNPPVVCSKNTHLMQEAPLHIAARHGALSVVQALLGAGASCAALDQQRRLPLHAAAEYVPIAQMQVSAFSSHPLSLLY